MDCYQIVFVANFFLLFLLPAVALFLLIPQSLREFQKWKKGRNPKNLSAAIILASLSFFSLCTFYLISMEHLISQTEIIAPNKLLNSLILIFLILFTYYVLIPQSIKHYNSWKSNGKPIYFSMMI